MATKLPKRNIVFIGGGLTAALAARQLTANGVEVLVLERGADLRESAAAKIPSQRDELRWGVQNRLAQDWAVETYTLR
ncbi:MAG TPA: NAD(P)-binding protein, partial [Burkholderiales bacterium]|nr:NAD(P)-binding protein [Burkholderiales bacterium]